MHFPIIDIFTVTQSNMYTERETEGKLLLSVARWACSMLILKSETIEFLKCIAKNNQGLEKSAIQSRKASCHVANAFFTRLFS